MARNLWILLLLLLSIIPGRAVEAVSANRVAVILGTSEWKPLCGSDIPGKGLAVRIVTTALENNGLDVEIQFLPWKRCEMMLQMKELDAVFPYTRTIERTATYAFSDPILTVRTEFFYLKTNIRNLSFDSYRDLKKYRIGGLLGYFYQKVFEEAGLHVEYVPTVEQNIGKLITGRIDITPIANVNGWYIINKQFPKEAHKFSTVEYDLPGKRMTDEEIACRIMVLKDYRKGSDIIKAYNEGITKMKENGEYEKIFKEYGLTSPK